MPTLNTGRPPPQNAAYHDFSHFADERYKKARFRRDDIAITLQYFSFSFDAATPDHATLHISYRRAVEFYLAITRGFLQH